jgi:hypothetical protein
MDSTRKIGVAVAVAAMTVGAGWLLDNAGVAPAIEWLWTLGLAVTGVLSVVLLGFDRVTAVVGPFLVVCSVFSILQQTGRIEVYYEIPILVILFGVLLLAAVVFPLKSPEWLLREDEDLP